MTSLNINLALSSGQPPAIAEWGSRVCKNPPALYPGDSPMTNQTCPKANEPTPTNAGESSDREASSVNNNYETLEPYRGPNEWTTVDRQKGKQRKRNEKRIRQLINFEKNFEERTYFVSIFNL